MKALSEPASTLRFTLYKAYVTLLPSDWPGDWPGDVRIRSGVPHRGAGRCCRCTDTAYLAQWHSLCMRNRIGFGHRKVISSRRGDCNRYEYHLLTDSVDEVGSAPRVERSLLSVVVLQVARFGCAARDDFRGSFGNQSRVTKIEKLHQDDAKSTGSISRGDSSGESLLSGVGVVSKRNSAAHRVSFGKRESMTNQDASQNNVGAGRSGPPVDLARFWEDLGAGGRIIFGFGILLAVTFYFNQNAARDWVDVNLDDVAERTQLTQLLADNQIEYRINSSDVIQVKETHRDRVAALLQEEGVVEEGADPYAWVRQPGSFLENSRQREQRLERSQIDKLEEDIANFQGIRAASVTPNRFGSTSQLGSNRRVSSVSVQVDLEEELGSVGLSRDLARTIGLHVCGVYGIGFEEIVLTDTAAHHYDLVNPVLTGGDIANKKRIIEGHVDRYLAAIFDRDQFRVVVDVNLAGKEPETTGYIRGEGPIVPGIYDLQKQVSSYSPISAQFVDSVVTRTTAPQIPDNTQVDPEIADVQEVAVTVMLDRAEVLERGTSIADGVATAGGAEAPSQAKILKDFIAVIVSGLETHLKVKMGADSVIQARILPVSFGSATAVVPPVVATTSAGTVVAAGTDSSFFAFFFLAGVFACFYMFKFGPYDSLREVPVVGFGASSFPREKVQETVNSINFECETSITQKALARIGEIEVQESAAVIRFVLSMEARDLPGSSVLMLLVLEQCPSRAEVFDQMNPEELTALSTAISQVSEIHRESIADALAALDLFRADVAAVESGNGVPTFVGAIPTQVEIDRSVIDEIRSNDEKIADLIEGKRDSSSPREVQSS